MKTCKHTIRGKRYLVPGSQWEVKIAGGKMFISYRDQQQLTYQQQDKSDNNSLKRIVLIHTDDRFPSPVRTDDRIPVTSTQYGTY
jgi:hypothetical protein